MSRRTLGRMLAASSALALVGCRRQEEATATATPETDADADATTNRWALGGTAAMVMKASYPSPFAASASKSCDLTCQATEGPCTADTTEREDVSEGMTGLPVRLLLRVVDSDCKPIVGAKVQIWHTQRTGVYSGKTPSGSFCYGDDPGAEQHLYFRGFQSTDSSGVASFDTCFPGWYSSRAPHIHFQIRLGDDLYLTSQFVFDDALCKEIYSSHPEYVENGLPDTTISTDTVLGGVDEPAPYIFDVARMEDGAMLASKTITIRTDLSAEVCRAEGGDRGPGGPPGQGGRPGGPPPARP